MIVARVFFVWVSVFNLFAVAVFWSFMADLFTSEQGKRLFGFIGAGGTAGSLLGPVITIALVGAARPRQPSARRHRVSRTGGVLRPPARARTFAPQARASNEQRVGGSAFAALPELIRSPYLLGVGAWVSLLSFGATIALFRAGQHRGRHGQGAGAQTRIFASIDLAVGAADAGDAGLRHRALLKRFGTGVAAGALPAVYIVGFATLALAPVLTVVLVFQVVQRWLNFAIANPARQVFFTVVGREEKYKAKNLIDVVIYRGSDALYGWVFDSLQALGLKLGAIALCALPVVAGWLVLSAALGRTQKRRAARPARAGAGRLTMTPYDPPRFNTAGGRGVAGAARLRANQRDAADHPRHPGTASVCRRSALAPPVCSARDDEQTRRNAAQVVRTLVDAGGRLIDTASTYGDAESVLGNVIAAAGLADKVFLATKVEAPDAAEFERSLARLKISKVDLLQLHNVRDPRQSLAQFKDVEGARSAAATSASRRPTTAISPRSKRCSGTRSRISCRSTIRWTTA